MTSSPGTHEITGGTNAETRPMPRALQTREESGHRAVALLKNLEATASAVLGWDCCRVALERARSSLCATLLAVVDNPLWRLRFEIAVHFHSSFCGPAVSPHRPVLRNVSVGNPIGRI